MLHVASVRLLPHRATGQPAPRTLTQIGDRVATSTLSAAWNAVIYLNQFEDERLDEVVQNGSYPKATQEVRKKHDGL